MTFPAGASADGPDSDVVDISSLIPMVAKAHRNLAGSLLADLGLAAGQQFVLMLLWEASPRTQSELTRQLMIEPPTTAKMLARLESAGFITRARSETDRRAVLVSLTDLGRAMEGPVTAVWHKLDRQTTQHLTTGEEAELRRLLLKVTRSLMESDADTALSACPSSSARH
jgi:DNA-binding MarR family transcriptional regulator